MEDVFYNLTRSPVLSAVADVGNEQLSPTIRVEPEKLPEMITRRNTYPKQQWLALKPIIEQLYVNEGQTFSKVAEYLRAHHAFSPT
jgi:hypothetical protein